jgi:thiol-disulfide isomerase/thioredoxin
MQFINSRDAGAWVTSALDLIQQHLTWPIIIVMFLMGCVGVVVLFLLFKKYGSRIKIMEGLTSTSMDSPEDGSSAQLLFFSTDWCPHCKVAQPEWDKLVSKYEGQLINSKPVIFTHYNCTTETPEIKALISQYNINGYPTVKLLKDGQVIDFDAKPTEASLTQFLQASV